MSEATMPLTEKQENVEEEEEPNFMAQWKTILLLIWLYLLQGVVIAFPISLRAVMAYEVDMCEDERRIDTLLGFATLPFSVKIVVAPIVDYLELPFFKGNHLIIIIRRKKKSMCRNKRFRLLYIILIYDTFDRVEKNISSLWIYKKDMYKYRSKSYTPGKNGSKM